MKTKKMILLAIFAVFTFSSCNGEELCRSELSEAKKQSIPYEKGQVISFTNAEGQTIDMTVTESKLDWRKETEGFYNDYRLSQIKTVILKSMPDNLEISMGINADGCLEDGYSLLNIRVNNNWGISLISDEKGDLWTDNNTSFHESIEINGKVYYDVFEQKNYKSIQLFYNKTYGILQIVRDNKNFLTLIPDQGKTLSALPKNEVSVDTDPDIQLYDEEENMEDNQEVLKSLESASEIPSIPSVDFTVYPNPNDGNFTVKVSGDVQPFTLEIFNDKGRLIETIRGKNEVININKTKYVQGAYFVRIYMGGKTAVRKIVVQ